MSIGFFGLIVAIGFLLSGFVLWKRAKEEHLDEQDAFNICTTAMIWALVVSRAVAVALRFDEFGLDPLRWISIFSVPGLNGVAALITMVSMILIAALKRRRDSWMMLDVFSPALLLMEASIVVIPYWYLGILWAVLTPVLLWIEREYRLWDWYKAKRGGARPGIVVGAWFVGNGLGFLVLARGGLRMVSWGVVGFLMIVIGMVLIYQRSGRLPRLDMMRMKARQ